jgi:hypothetical protein
MSIGSFLTYSIFISFSLASSIAWTISHEHLWSSMSVPTCITSKQQIQENPSKMEYRRLLLNLAHFLS